MPERLLRTPPPVKRKQKQRHGGAILLVVLLLIGAVAGYAAVKPLPAPRTFTMPVVSSTLATQPVTWPTYGQSAVGAVGFGVLATQGPQTALATASTAKIMTALAVLQRKPLSPGDAGPNITITQADVDSYNEYVAQDGSVVPVTVGEQLSEYQALQAMLLPSANNIADTLARWAFGSVDAYIAYANSYADKQGLTGLHFTDASGLASATTGNATDLTRLGQLAMANPVIATIAQQPSAELPVAGTVYNVNALLGQDGIVGLKTGNNDADPGAFMFASEQTVGTQKLTIIGTVMGAPDLQSALLDSLPLIRSTSANFHQVIVAKTGQVVGKVQVPWQADTTFVASRDLSDISWNGQAQAATIKLQPLSLPLKRGTVVGTLSVKGSAGQTSTVDIRLSRDIMKPTYAWRLRHVF